MPVVLTPAPSSRAFSGLIYLVAPHVTGCPPPQIVTALRQAATELCRDGWVWQADLDPISVVAGTDSYTLTSPSSDGALATVRRVVFDGQVLRPRTLDSLQTSKPRHPDVTTPGTPTHWAMRDTVTITLHPVPAEAAASALKVRVMLVPTRNAGGIERQVAEDYEEELVWGALWRLLAMQKKHWSNIRLADFYGRKFKNAVSLARARVNKGLIAHSLQVTFLKVM